ncbi:hypothetical protein EVA_05815, partial [gut metagenome]
MGELIIKGKLFKFSEVELTYENATVINPSTAKNNLLEFREVMKMYQVKFLLMHGTLLGAI